MRWIWIDRFTKFKPGKSAQAVKNVTLAEEHLHDHFPGYPVMPATLIIEGIAQTAGILVSQASDFKEKVVLAKVSKALHSVSQDFWHQGVIPEEQYLEEIGNCLEFKTIPSVAGLMPTHHPKHGFLGSATDPHARMEKAAKALRDLTEVAIRTGDLSDVMRRIEGVIPVCDKREVLKQRVRAAKELSRDWPRCALGPLRLPPDSLDDALLSDWVPPSQLNQLVNDRYEASIVIEHVDGMLVAKLKNSDAVGRRFREELASLEAAYELLAR